MIPIAERLHKRLKITPKPGQAESCWEWQGHCDKDGYGQISKGRKGEGLLKTHRVAWEEANGPIPDDLGVLHRCDNPSCCNPEHLFLGTHDDNMADMRAKRRGAKMASPKLVPLHIEERSVDSLTPYQRNPRTHSAKQIRQIADSIETFGFVNPVLIDATGTVIAGHGRLRAAKQLGMATVPAIRLDHLSEEKARALVIADNKLAELAGWDEDMLALELQSLTEMKLEMDLDFDLSVIGFDEGEFARLIQMETDGATDDDDVPSEVEKRCKAGDLWKLGDHRLLCGDATNAKDVAYLLGDEKPQLCVTDPPYGVNYDPAWRAEAASKGLLIFSPTRVGEVDNDDRADWREAWDLFKGDVIYTWSAVGPLSIISGLALLDSGFEIRTQIIWRKPHFPLSRGHYTYQHEPCWYAVKKGRKAHWIGDPSSSTVWEVTLDKNVEGGHSTQKPVELFTRAIANHQGDVYEPFCGSGTCVVACEKLDRHCFAMEISPKYCDVILQRWEKFTESKAERITKEENTDGEGTDDNA